MQHSPAAASLDDFRQALYTQVLGRRKDTLCDLADAVLTASGPDTLVRLTLSPLFRRRWSSASDALAEGTLDEAACRRLCAQTLPAPASTQRPIWALDGTTWPRPAAVTSPERTWGYRPLPGHPDEGVVPGWEYQWLVAVPLPGTSWVAPLDVARRGPTAAGVTTLAIEQLQRVLARVPAAYPRPVTTFDSSYDPIALARAIRDPDPTQRLACDGLVRLSRRCCFFRPPPPASGTGRPRTYGAVLRVRDPSTHGEPDATATGHDERHGRIEVALWRTMRREGAADTPLTLVRVRVERLPRARRTPEPLWLAWVGEHEPADLLDYWRWYGLRFTVEQGFRFLKHELGWTTIRVQAPASADRWSWLVAAVLWELWLGRALIREQRLPWERPRSAADVPPGRVRRGMGTVMAALGSPARIVQPRGKAPGRPLGQCPGPRARQPVARRVQRAPPRAT